MGKNMIYKMLKEIFESKTFILLIFYLIIGSIFTSFQYVGDSYLYIFAQVLTNKIYITIFVFPVLIVMYLYLYKNIESNYLFLLRIGNRKTLFKIVIEAGIRFITYYMVILLLIIGISTNIVEHKNVFYTYTLGYDVVDVVVLFISIIKIYVFMFIYYLMTIYFLIKTKQEQFTLFLLFISLMIIFLNSRFAITGTLSFLNIDIHFYNLRGFSKIVESFIYTFLYDFVVIAVLFRLAKKIQ